MEEEASVCAYLSVYLPICVMLEEEAASLSAYIVAYLMAEEASVCVCLSAYLSIYLIEAEEESSVPTCLSVYLSNGGGGGG